MHTLHGFFNLSTWLTAIAGAAVLLLVFHLLSGRSSRSGPRAPLTHHAAARARPLTSRPGPARRPHGIHEGCQFPGSRSFRYTTCRRSGPSSTSRSSKSSAGSVVIPIRRITACERRFFSMVTATISGRPMVPKP